MQANHEGGLSERAGQRARELACVLTCGCLLGHCDDSECQTPRTARQEKTIVRCAIHTRKSTEDGLDQEFNLLDAQRLSGENYVRSAEGEGWRVIPDLYDDGGFTGGNMDRPVLKRLIADIEAGRIA